MNGPYSVVQDNSHLGNEDLGTRGGRDSGKIGCGTGNIAARRP